MGEDAKKRGEFLEPSGCLLVGLLVDRSLVRWVIARKYYACINCIVCRSRARWNG